MIKNHLVHQNLYRLYNLSKKIKMKTLAFIGAISIIVLVHSEEQNEANVPEALQDLQTEFWLPYSVTEDVDFTILRPEAYGCYLW